MTDVTQWTDERLEEELLRQNADYVTRGSAKAELTRRQRQYELDRDKVQRQHEIMMGEADDKRDVHRKNFEERLAKENRDHAEKIANEQLKPAQNSARATKFAAAAAALSAIGGISSAIVSGMNYHDQKRIERVEERPWIFTEAKENWTVRLIAGGDGGYFLELKGLPLLGTNTGKLSAQQASIDWDIATSMEPSAIKKVQDQVCLRAKQDVVNRQIGLPVLPGQPRDFTNPYFGKSLAPPDILKAERGVRGEIPSISVIAVGCVSYFDDLHQLHQSGFAYKAQFNGTVSEIHFDGDAIPVTSGEFPVKLVPMNYAPLFFAD